MDHIYESELPAVGEAARAVVREAKAAGVWNFGGGLRQRPSVVGVNGTIAAGPVTETKAVVGGFFYHRSRLERGVAPAGSSDRSDCRYAQEVREIGYDPES